MHAETTRQRMTWKALAIGGVLILTATAFAGCFGGNPPPGTPPTITLNGAGATFPAPLYDKWQGAYTANVNASVHINYNAVGSGAGITQITNKTVDFAGSDAPMSSTEMTNAPGILHIPSTLGAVVLIYNIPGYAGTTLNFTGDTLAKIFNGNIVNFNDTALVALNPLLVNISHNITIVHRSDGSGTTFVFSSYLHKVAPNVWTAAGSKNWPNTLGLGGSGNSGVSSAVQQNTFTIGYVELSYATTTNPPLVFGNVLNHDGFFITANATTTAAAAAAVTTLPAGDASWSSVEILNQAGRWAYPIASMTYLLVYKSQPDAAKGEALANFIWWAIHNDGQSLAAPNGYAPLPLSTIWKNENTTDLIVSSTGVKLRTVAGLGYPPVINPGGGGGPVTLNGAGATFPAPLYDVWQGTYTATVMADTHINYNAVGSGAGITQITGRQVDFGASDAPMSATEFANAAGIMHIPTTLGAVVIVYNNPEVSWSVNFTAAAIAKIFNGNITMWNDAELVADNPGLASVAHNITPVHRSDGSGTTFVFSSYLHLAAATDWPSAGSKNWPNTVGIGGSGNSGVSSGVQQNTYSIGYVELSFASTSSTPLTLGKVENHNHKFVAADTNSTAAAAASLNSLPAGADTWTGVNILDQTGNEVYPIASMTYILVYQTQVDHDKGQALVDFLWWATHDGQQYCAPHGYAPLPASVVTNVEVSLRSVHDAAGNTFHA